MDDLVCTRPGTRSYVDESDGLIKYAAANVPVFGSKGVNHLGEDGYTQFLDWTEDFTEWVAPRLNTTGLTYIDGPLGEATAFPLVGNTDNSSHAVYVDIAGWADDTVMQSVYHVHPNTGDYGSRYCCIALATKNGTWPKAYFDLQEGTVTSSTCDGASISGPDQFGFYTCRAWQDMGAGVATANNGLRACLVDGSTTFEGDNETPNLWISHAQVIEGTVEREYVPSSGAAVVQSGETLTIPINATLEDLLSDALPSGTPTPSEFTLFFEVTPEFNAADVTGSVNLVSVQDTGASISAYDAANTQFEAFDSANTALVNSGLVKDATYIQAVRGKSSTSKLNTAVSADAGVNWTVGTDATYDGAFPMDTNLIFGADSNLPANYRWLPVYDEWVPDARLTSAFYGSSPGMGMDMKMG